MESVHLDTDLGGDIDDLCALAMLLQWPELEITGITTTAESSGRRAGYVRHMLALSGRSGIPVAPGADVSDGHFRYPELSYPQEERYWGRQVAASPGPVDAALRLLQHSIEAGALVIAIGPFTNLSLLEQQHRGILKEARLCLMGGHILPPHQGYPDLGNEWDWNVQLDARSALHVIDSSDPLLVPITITVQTALRHSHIKALQQAGPLSQLVARQARAFAEDEKMDERYGTEYEKVPEDIINFLHDPLACAVGLGWNPGVQIEEMPLGMEIQDGWLHERLDSGGRRFRVVTGVDGAAFGDFWLHHVTSESRSRPNL